MYNAPVNGIPHSPTPWLDGDLTEYHANNEPLPWGVTGCQYTYLSPRIDRGLIGDLT